MTFRVHYFADQAFLSMVKRIIDNGKLHDEETKISFEPEECATALIICHSACEAFLNIFANNLEITDFFEYEKKSILDKITILLNNTDNKPDWAKNPLQDIRKLDKVRNWLTHFKSSDIGLINSMNQWVKDDFNKVPKINDFEELKYFRVQKYYNNVRATLILIATSYGLEEEYEYLITENYSSYLIG